jgi:hypothetical protein
MKKLLKILIYTILTLSLLIFISGFLVVSYPFFLNTYAHLLVKLSATESNDFNYQTYSKEEFALKYLNTSLTPKDDFISIFKSHYGVKNADIRVVIYSKLKDPDNSLTHTVYGIISPRNSSSLLFKGDINDPEVFDFHIYSKEEFTSKYLNTSLTSQDDFISLYENYYGIGNSNITFVSYEIEDHDDRLLHTLYGINQCEDTVYTISWKEGQFCLNESGLSNENQTTNIISQGNIKSKV